MLYSPDKIIIKNDFEDLTPPFCYRYTLILLLKDQIEADLTIEYYDREGLDEEEIYAEGFSNEDDFTWKGELSNVWKDEMLTLINKAKPGKTKDNFELMIQEGNNLERLVPKNMSQFEYLVQELIQGIYEIAGKQSELGIELISNIPSAKIQFGLVISFRSRTAMLKQDGTTKEIDWKTSQQMLGQLYSFPMDSFNTYDEKPTKKGVFINLGDGYWYEAGVSILPNKDKSQSEGKLIHLFQNLG